MSVLCDPLTPMQWNDLYCLSHPEVHTLSIGAAKPSDFDEHVEAVERHMGDPIVESIENRIRASMEKDLGVDWMRDWHKDLPHYTDTPGNINVKETLRLWTFYKGLDLGEFAKMRYNLLGTADHWFPGEKAVNVDTYDWACLAQHPFRQRIPAILKEAHAAFHEDKDAKRLSES
ncbi:MAG: hypothetical protein HKP10_02025 [Kiritimatiellales bacterium]|nr:hypothetical protein [Kiritimatiellales bacterium]